LKGLLPEPVLNKKKVGLEMPYSLWFFKELKEMGEHYFSKENVRGTGLFNPLAVNQLWADHQKKSQDNGRILWGLLNYLLWHEMYISKKTYRSYLDSEKTYNGV